MLSTRSTVEESGSTSSSQPSTQTKNFITTTEENMSTPFTTEQYTMVSKSDKSTSIIDLPSPSAITIQATASQTQHSSSTLKSTTSANIIPTTHTLSTSVMLRSTTGILSTSTLFSNSKMTPTTFPPIATTMTCNEDKCQCNGHPCVFNDTLGICRCNCTDFSFGDSCVYGEDVTGVKIDFGAVPTRKANVSLKIMREFVPEYKDINSTQSQMLIKTLITELSALCRRADPQNFKDVQVLNIKKGSTIIESIVQYFYTNNETQISFLNKKLELTLRKILYNYTNLMTIGQAFGNVHIQVTNFIFQPIEIKSITELRPFVTCSLDFANYTQEVVDGSWKCEGPCKQHSDYCHRHGECFNVKTGPVCQCFESYLEQYHGPQCELFSRGRGFYAAVFGALGAGFLLILVIIVVVVVLRRNRLGLCEKARARRRMSLNEDFFDFTERGEDTTDNSY
ncbi:hypothetical protein UPYG_G00170830 [Umbra pygmaea]|uniref:Uncharacterized protein n=1 Tax=Umbra pygmaea TaxID=75934 RepID=A0ABD0X9M5_UMBPY